MVVKGFRQFVNNHLAKLPQIMLQKEGFLTIEKVKSAGFLGPNRLLQTLQPIGLFLFFCHGFTP